MSLKNSLETYIAETYETTRKQLEKVVNELEIYLHDVLIPEKLAEHSEELTGDSLDQSACSVCDTNDSIDQDTGFICTDCKDKYTPRQSHD